MSETVFSKGSALLTAGVVVVAAATAATTKPYVASSSAPHSIQGPITTNDRPACPLSTREPILKSIEIAEAEYRYSTVGVEKDSVLMRTGHNGQAVAVMLYDCAGTQYAQKWNTIKNYVTQNCSNGTHAIDIDMPSRKPRPDDMPEITAMYEELCASLSQPLRGVLELKPAAPAEPQLQ